MHSPTQPVTGSRPPIGFREFVALMAALMSINALGIDTMLPALPDIARDLGMTTENQRQWVITSYLIGFGLAQLLYGPVADRFGRRPVMLAGLLLYTATSVIASFADTFPTLIVARTLQGMAAAASRVLVISMVRDCYSGRQMARVMSLTFIVFLAAPILAPSIGQLILIFAPWEAIFHGLGLFAAVLAIWLVLRLGETLHPEYRRSIDVREIAAAARLVFTNRHSLGYTLALSMTFGAMIGFVTSAQQLFTDVFDAPNSFPLIFAFIAGAMGVASYVNSRIVMRLGSRRVSHAALLGYIVMNAIHLISIEIFGDSLLSFALFQFAIMFCSGLVGSNFGAMAMDPMGAIAGTASSVQGTISTLIAAAIGIVVGQSFDGSAVPIVLGFFIGGIGALIAVLYAERGKLFRSQHVAPTPGQ
jgi:DHA1 family bicyclomycin/chloramphenicol resistance-like MFS transporter